MNDENFAPVNNTDPVSAEDLMAQVDALLGDEDAPAQAVSAPLEASAPETPADQAPVFEEVPPVSEEVPPVFEEVPPVFEEVPPVSEEVPPVSEEVPPVGKAPAPEASAPNGYAPYQAPQGGYAPYQAPQSGYAPYQAPQGGYAPAPNAQGGYSAPAGYELRYVQTPQGYQAVYMPVQSAGYAQPYAQPAQAPAPRSKANQRPKSASASPRTAQQRPRNAVKARPRKKPWGKIFGACVLSVAIVAVVVWAVVAGSTALIRRMGGSRNGGMGDGYYDDGYGGNWSGMGGYDDGGYYGDGGYYIDEYGNLVDGNGNILGNVHDGGSYWDEDGNMVVISPINPGNDDYSPVDPENSLMFVRADGGLNVRETPDGDRLATVPNGFPVYVYAFQGSWAHISYGDMSGWVDADYLSYEPVIQQKLYYVHADGGLNMRAEPTTASSRIENIPNGTQIYSLARFEDWVFTFYGGTYGWVHSDYLGDSAPKATQPQQGNQGNPGSTGGYTMADIEAAMAQAKEYYRSRKGKTPSGGLRRDSLTDAQVEELYWEAVGLVVGMQYFPAGQFQNIDGMLELSDGYGFFYQVSDPKIKSMEDWADMYYSVLTDDLACDILCGTPMFILDGKMYISGGAMGDEGLLTQYTTRVEAEPGGYKFIMDVVNIREDDYAGTTERMEWSFTAHCFKEDGVWVFDNADTPYR